MSAPQLKTKHTLLMDSLIKLTSDGRTYLPSFSSTISNIENEGKALLLVKGFEEQAYDILLTASALRFDEKEYNRLWGNYSSRFEPNPIVYHNQVANLVVLGKIDKAFEFAKNNFGYFKNLLSIDNLLSQVFLIYGGEYLNYINNITKNISLGEEILSKISYFNSLLIFFNEKNIEIMKFSLDFITNNNLVLLSAPGKKGFYEIIDPEDGEITTCFDLFIIKPQTDEDFKFLTQINDKFTDALLEKFGYKYLEDTVFSLCCAD